MKIILKDKKSSKTYKKWNEFQQNSPWYYPKKGIGRGNGINDLNKDLDTLWDNLEQESSSIGCLNLGGLSVETLNYDKRFIFVGNSSFPRKKKNAYNNKNSENGF